jgi:hypothetical protein
VSGHPQRLADDEAEAIGSIDYQSQGRAIHDSRSS